MALFLLYDPRPHPVLGHGLIDKHGQTIDARQSPAPISQVGHRQFEFLPFLHTHGIYRLRRHDPACLMKVMGSTASKEKNP
jgi:hypothetical protein